jgi:hypothetical protein
VTQELQDFLEFIHQKNSQVSHFFAKSLPKNLSASSPGQVTYTIKISGCCHKQRKKLPSGEHLFFAKKLAKKMFPSKVFANRITLTKRQALHTVKISERCNF